MLRLEGVATGYRELEVLHEVSLEVDENDAVALVGANGAGKTTALNTISGVLPIWRGRATFEGQDLAHVPPHRRVDMGLVHVPQGRQVFPYMSVEENLQLGAFPKSTYGNRHKNMKRVYELFPRLAERRSQHAGTLSGGEQQMLVIGRGLMAQPRLLMLDEPSQGLSPVLVKTIFEIIETIHSTGVAILLVEQNVTHALRIARHGYVIESGNTVMQGPSSELLSDPMLRRAFLGL